MFVYYVFVLWKNATLLEIAILAVPDSLHANPKRAKDVPWGGA